MGKYAEICTLRNQIEGELACRDLSDKAHIIYDDTDPLTVYKYKDDDGEEKYAYISCLGDEKDLTFEELQKTFEEIADMIASDQI